LSCPAINRLKVLAITSCLHLFHSVSPSGGRRAANEGILPERHFAGRARNFGLNIRQIHKTVARVLKARVHVLRRSYWNV